MMQTARPIDLNFRLLLPPLAEEAAAEADATAGEADADATIAADVLLEMEMEMEGYPCRGIVCTSLFEYRQKEATKREIGCCQWKR